MSERTPLNPLTQLRQGAKAKSRFLQKKIKRSYVARPVIAVYYVHQSEVRILAGKTLLKARQVTANDSFFQKRQESFMITDARNVLG